MNSFEIFISLPKKRITKNLILKIKIIPALFLSVLCTFLFLNKALAQWPNDPANNLPVSTTPGLMGGFGNGESESIEIVTDGDNGAIISWTHDGIYTQRVDANGSLLWGKNGQFVGMNQGTLDYQGTFRVVADGKGGAIFVWPDINWDIYAQRLNSNGTRLWSFDGVPVAQVGGTQSWPEVTADGAGGAFFVWRDQRDVPSDSYIQWIDAQGKAKWQANGINISSANNHQYYPKIISDGQGGIIVTWMDDRSHTSFYHWEIYAQRFNSSGQPQWQTNGVLVRGEAGEAYINPEIVSDGNGGAIIIWRKNATDCNFSFPCPREVYAQRLNSAGKKLWKAEGVRILPEGQSPFSAQQWTRALVPDNQGGAYLAYSDGGFPKAQHIGSSGDLLWGNNGLNAISESNGFQEQVFAVEDGQGGIVIAWENWITNDEINIHGQRIDANGNKKWGMNGAVISTAPGKQFGPKLVSDNKGGAIVTWNDFRDGYSEYDKNSSIYAQRVFRTGQLQEPKGIAPVYILLE